MSSGGMGLSVNSLSQDILNCMFLSHTFLSRLVAVVSFKSRSSLKVRESTPEGLKDCIDLMRDYIVYCLEDVQQIKIASLTNLVAIS